MNPIRRLGFFAFAMLHFAAFMVLILTPVIPDNVGLPSRIVAAALLQLRFGQLLAEAIRDTE